MTVLHLRRTWRLSLQAAGLSDKGCVRDRNEDAIFEDCRNGLFIVADGMGGRNCGDVAAQETVKVLPGIIKQWIWAVPDERADADPAIVEILRNGVQELSGHIRALSLASAERAGMGTTVVVALVTGHHVHVAHMGDSRAYLFRYGVLQQLTSDHSLIGLLVANGEITSQEAEDHPARGRLIRYVGMDAGVGPDVRTVEVQSGDRMLLCTDGLWGMVPEERMVTILSGGENPGVTCCSLLSAGNAAGGSDNLTALVVDIGEEAGVYETQSSG
jgi:PPM family protein phosphatase